MAATLVAIPAALFLGRDVIPPVRFFLWHLSSLLWFGLILFSAWWQGSVVFQVMVPRVDEDPPFPRTAISIGLGLGFLALEVFILGAAGYFCTVPFTLLVLVLTVVGALDARRHLQALSRDWRRMVQAARRSVLPISLAGLAAAVTFPFALIPTRAFDALAYHLDVPLRYLQAGRIIDVPENLYSYAPQLVHSLYGLAMGLAGSDLAGLLNWVFFILCLVVLWVGFEGILGSEGGAWAAALGALSPMMLIETANSGVDWGAAFYTLAALSLIATGGKNRRRVILAGILAGMAAGCRHHPLLWAIILPPLAGLADDLISRRRPGIGLYALFAAAALLAASPWYIRNWIYTGDPLFPLIANLTGTTDAGSNWVNGLVGGKSPSLLWRWIFLPFRVVFDPLSQSMTATVGIQFLVLLPLLAVKTWRINRNRFLFVWFVLAFMAWYWNFQTARYAMPILLAATLWLGPAVSEILKDRKGLSRCLQWGLAATLLCNAGVFIGIQDRVNRSVGAAFGTRSSYNYLMETYEVYPAIDHLNTLDPPARKVLFVGEMRGFYSQFPREVSSHNMPNRILELIKGGMDRDAAAKDLVDAGFSHLLVNTSEWQRMAYRNRSAPAWRLSEEQEARFAVFLAGNSEPIFSDGSVTVYSLATDPGP